MRLTIKKMAAWLFCSKLLNGFLAAFGALLDEMKKGDFLQ